MRPPSVGITNDGLELSPRLHVTKEITGLTFFDTGADISLLLSSGINKTATPRCQRLTGQDLWTKRILTLDFGIRRSITWQFTVADVSRPVIGADLLRHHGFIVDIQGKRLIDKLTQLNVPGFKRQIAYASIKTIDSTSTYYHILVDYPRITKEPQLPVNRAHGIFHHIPTEDPPVASRKLRKRTFDAARDMLIFQ